MLFPFFNCYNIFSIWKMIYFWNVLNQSSLSFTPNWISIQSWMSNDEFMIINLIQPAITSTLFQTTFYQKTKLVIIDSCNFATFKRIDLKLFKGYFNNPIIYINDKTFYHKIDLLIKPSLMKMVQNTRLIMIKITVMQGQFQPFLHSAFELFINYPQSDEFQSDS